MLNIRFVVVALALVASLLFAVCTADAQCARWLPGVFAQPIDGRINAIVRWDPDGAGPQPELLVVGGTFTTIGTQFYPRMAAWDGQRWLQIGPTDGEVLALAVHNGELIVGGVFTNIGGVVARCVAAYNGQSWRALASTIAPTTNIAVRTLTTFEGRLVVGGTFTSIDGVGAQNVAAFDGTQWSSFGSGLSSSVLSLHVHNGALHAGGTFSSSCVSRWTGTIWSPVGVLSSGGGIGALSLTTHDGTLFAGGSFSIPVPGSTSISSPLVRLQLGTWSPLPGMTNGGTVQSLYSTPSRLYFGGVFTNVGDFVSNLIAAWNGTSVESLEGGLINSNTSSFGVADIDEFNGDLVAAGDFDRSFGNAATVNIGLYGSLGWRGITPSTNDTVNCIATYRGEMYLGGEFTAGGGIGANRIVAWNGQTWSNVGGGVNWIGSSGTASLVRAMVVHDDRLIVGGTFNAAGNWICNNVAAWDGVEWQPLGVGLSSTVDALCVHNGQLYASGNFNSSGLNNLPGRIARWTGTSWVPVGTLSISSFSSSNRALISFDNTLYHMGSGYAFSYDGTTWTNQFPNQSVTIACAEIHNNELYIAGSFTPTAPIPLRSIAKLSGTSWVDVGGGFQGTSSLLVHGLKSYNGRLYAAGEFNIASGLPANRIASFDGTNWEALGAGATAVVRTLNEFGGDLVLGGDFTATGTTLASFWSRYTSDGRPAVIAGRLAPTSGVGSTYTIGVNVLPGHDLNGPLQFAWTREGVPVSNGSGPGGTVSGATTNRLTITNVQLADAGVYACTVTNSCGTRSVTFPRIDFVFVCRADINNSGQIDPQDIFEYLNLWFSRATGADFNNDGGINPQDIFDFLNAWFAGC